MWNGNKVWLHFLNNILAADSGSAAFLGSYLRRSGGSMANAPFIEIIDLQKYKVIKQPHKVRAALRERLHIPFIFVVGKN